MACTRKTIRKRIETIISQITSLIRHINVVTTNGFIIKLVLFVMAFQIDQRI